MLQCTNEACIESPLNTVLKKLLEKLKASSQIFHRKAEEVSLLSEHFGPAVSTHSARS